MRMHRRSCSLYLFRVVHSVVLDLLQRSVKEVCDRRGEKGKLHLLKNRTHEGEESWNQSRKQHMLSGTQDRWWLRTFTTV